MEKKRIFYSPDVRTEISGRELEEEAERMVAYFTKVMYAEYQEGKFPHWNDSVRQLVENAWVLWKWRAFADPKTGRNPTLKAIATQFCHILHVPLPANISSEVHRSLRTRRKSVVDYYAMLWREGRVDVDTFVDWQEPISMPLPTSYRGLFD